MERPDKYVVRIGNRTTKIKNKAFCDNKDIAVVIVPDSVTEIGAEAFAGCAGLTDIVLPDSLAKIGEEAFSGCASLTSFTVPGALTEIGERAFHKCCGLTAVYISDISQWCEKVNFTTNLFSGENANPLEYAHHMYLNGKEVKDLVIPDSVKKIGKMAFSGCSGITSVTIPDSVEEIDRNAFDGCTGLTDIALPDSITSIGWNTFCGCTKLASITIPESVTKIISPFSGCTGLTSIFIPKNVTEFNLDDFQDCVNLQSIKVDKDNPVFDSREDCNAIILTESNTLLAGCNNTVIPDSVEKISSLAFAGRTGLTSFVIPNSVKKIGDHAFDGCTGLTNITLSDNLTEIAFNAFYGCTSLTSIVIPDSVTKIGDNAFEGCTSLKNIVIPASLTDIGWHAFEGCPGKMKESACSDTSQAVVPEDDSESTCGDDLMGWLKTVCIVETEDDVYYDAEAADKEEVDLFINNLKAQNTEEENELLEKLSFDSAQDFVKYLDDDPDEIGLPYKMIAAAYCTCQGIEIKDDTQMNVDEQLYYFNDSRDVHYEYSTDIDLG